MVYAYLPVAAACTGALRQPGAAGQWQAHSTQLIDSL